MFPKNNDEASRTKVATPATTSSPTSSDNRAEYAANVLEHDRRSCWKKALIPPRHRLRIEQNTLRRQGQWGQQLDKVVTLTNQKEGATIALVGSPGSGKTQLAVEAMRQSIWKMTKPTAMFTDIADIILAMRSTYQTRGISERDCLRSFTSPIFLIIDDSDHRGESEWENNILHNIINKRYGAMKSTILIANQSADVLAQAIGPAMVSRIKELGGFIECNANDFRKRSDPEFNKLNNLTSTDLSTKQ